MRRATIVGIAAWAVFLLATPPVTRAECPYIVIPPATDAVRSARDVIVGTVVENVGGQLYDFRLRVDHVLRGGARVGEIRRFRFLYPGWPPDRGADGTLNLTDEGKPFMPCSPIPGAKGNVMALALGALAPDGKTRYNAASWIAGRLPINQDLPRTTLAEIRRLAELPDTATASGPDRPAAQQKGDTRLPLLPAGLLVGGVVAWRRVGRPKRGAADRVQSST